jgi:hypothetical protein
MTCINNYGDIGFCRRVPPNGIVWDTQRIGERLVLGLTPYDLRLSALSQASQCCPQCPRRTSQSPWRWLVSAHPP